MWFDDFEDEQESAGFADPCSFGVACFAWTFIIGLIGYLTWTWRALP